jgi:hypothetical protein
MDFVVEWEKVFLARVFRTDGWSRSGIRIRGDEQRKEGEDNGESDHGNSGGLLI